MARFTKTVLVFAPVLSLFGWWDQDAQPPSQASAEARPVTEIESGPLSDWLPFLPSWPFFFPKLDRLPDAAPPEDPAAQESPTEPTPTPEPTDQPEPAPDRPADSVLANWVEWLDDSASGGLAKPAGFQGFYGDQATGAQVWGEQNSGDPLATAVLNEIAAYPVAKWVAEGMGTELRGFVDAAAAESKVPVVVAYHIPNRDCGQHSAGGAADASEYREWVRTELAPAFQDHAAMLILEPDSLIHLPCLSEDQRQERLALLSDAVDVLAELAPNTAVYLDGGDGAHNSPAEMAPRLAAAGVDRARGFAVNVSNYNTDEKTEEFAAETRKLLTDQHGAEAGYVVDTSRNGAGPGSDWCNPPNRRLGSPPQLSATGGQGPDAHLWIKHPGTSDGDCGSGQGTVSGEFSPEIARELLDLN
ncbi:glycoside hydrolase family 6 protein [Actinoalloteichus hymeniacidonis]|uniref:Glucanase n=1 Tax=Actinoalloteichus hymeniacidonis TaxID=340345 RepID=A0AAC9HUW8_9PSEU|nr:glycoside hydrolase family 6 protein [Actinoalloteichus hymeniacidonis]AOS65898.1 Glycosyl hydrolases family 6 [Actinoalloteichus hymeniacidonis]MBB5906006.1 endoglucanase [Actinoalloteichus hymeniacidonis]